VSLAWIFDVTAGRIERTTPGPLKGAHIALVLVGIGVLAAACRHAPGATTLPNASKRVT
jgi:hypothetical protein